MSRFFTISLLIAANSAFGQSSYIPLNEAYYHGIDRYEIKAGRIFPQVFTTIKPYQRPAVVDFTASADTLAGFDSQSDLFNQVYLLNDNWEWSRVETSESPRPILKRFYRKKSDLYHVDEKDFDLHVNPVFYFSGGSDSRLDATYFINTRGVEVRGVIDGKVGFYSYLTDNQAVLPSYVSDVLYGPGNVPGSRVVPHEGFWKNYSYGNGVDFLQARGYFTFEATRHINLQFGHDRFFIGNGYRSLIFSDHGPPALFLKMNAKVWKINYLFTLNKMIADRTPIANTSKYPEKYVALHHLSINIGKRLNVGLFESVVFSSSDSTTFEWSYLNPIIFYRGIEQQAGSSDNVIIGADFKWNAFRKMQFYGQFVLDEFVIEHIRSGDGWWANKFGVQLGTKYIDAFGVSNLDLQGELNIVRPYTYSHYTKYGSYSNYRQAIAHPLGANFKEVVGVVRYQPVPRLNLVGKLIYAQVGRDTLNSEWNLGNNILTQSSSSYRKEFGNEIGQGVKNTITMMSLVASWQLKHNVFIDLSTVIRRSESEEAFYNNNSTLTSVALRINIPQRLYEF